LGLDFIVSVQTTHSSSSILLTAWIHSILWITVFGIFGKMYVKYTPGPDEQGQTRMKHAVWVDVANVGLWFVSAAYSTLFFFKGRGNANKGMV
jgi:hypothetical protein